MKRTFTMILCVFFGILVLTPSALAAPSVYSRFEAMIPPTDVDWMAVAEAKYADMVAPAVISGKDRMITEPLGKDISDDAIRSATILGPFASFTGDKPFDFDRLMDKDTKVDALIDTIGFRKEWVFLAVADGTAVAMFALAESQRAEGWIETVSIDNAGYAQTAFEAYQVLQENKNMSPKYLLGMAPGGRCFTDETDTLVFFSLLIPDHPLLSYEKIAEANQQNYLAAKERGFTREGGGGILDYLFPEAPATGNSAPGNALYFVLASGVALLLAGGAWVYLSRRKNAVR